MCGLRRRGIDRLVVEAVVVESERERCEGDKLRPSRGRCARGTKRVDEPWKRVDGADKVECMHRKDSRGLEGRENGPGGLSKTADGDEGEEMEEGNRSEFKQTEGESQSQAARALLYSVCSPGARPT